MFYQSDIKQVQNQFNVVSWIPTHLTFQAK